MSPRRSAFLVAMLAAVSCSPPTDRKPSPPDAPWTVYTTGSQTMLQRPDARAFISAGPADLDRGLPGLVEGSDKGPAYGLLGGYFAPRVLAQSATTAAQVRARGARVAVALPGIEAEVLPPQSGRLPIRLRGGATMTFPADRTDVQGLYQGRPIFAVAVSAGAEPGYRRWRADQVIIRSRRGATFEVRTDCPQVLLVHPVPRGSTSVFVLHVGPRPPPAAPLFMPSSPLPAEGRIPCDGASTSTLTVPLP